MERAIFGASEFFSQQAFLTGSRGIENVRVGHLERENVDIVEVWYNPWKVSYNEIVELFFDLHDATFKGDYRNNNQSIIFFSSIHQLAVAKQKKCELKLLSKDDIITEITPVRECTSILGELKLIS